MQDVQLNMESVFSPGTATTSLSLVIIIYFLFDYTLSICKNMNKSDFMELLKTGFVKI